MADTDLQHFHKALPVHVHALYGLLFVEGIVFPSDIVWSILDLVTGVDIMKVGITRTFSEGLSWPKGMVVLSDGITILVADYQLSAVIAISVDDSFPPRTVCTHPVLSNAMFIILLRDETRVAVSGMHGVSLINITDGSSPIVPDMKLFGPLIQHDNDNIFLVTMDGEFHCIRTDGSLCSDNNFRTEVRECYGLTPIDACSFAATSMQHVPSAVTIMDWEGVTLRTILFDMEGPTGIVLLERSVFGIVMLHSEASLSFVTISGEVVRTMALGNECAMICSVLGGTALVVSQHSAHRILLLE
jgi:hypothetical protein